eukprot:TRINITY_DN13503_c0_g1_i1.p1 TRINITY_DN13503_c0_g1~~TRINITY_DN13503_c0_g1_i1.p1  ORF type:complete len:100 (+),score=10.04 TRINITY_DN13503_c0_g1_i1:74-373(+)
MSHTILMYQPTSKLSSRTFSDFESLPLCLQGICHMFETRLKSERPNNSEITYDIADLFAFMDSFEDFSLLQYNQDKKGYEPYGLAAIRAALYNHIKSQS